MATRRRQRENINDVQENIPLIPANRKPKRSKCLCLTSCLCICVLILSLVGLILTALWISPSFYYPPTEVSYSYSTRTVILYPYDSRTLKIDRTCDEIDVSFSSTSSANLYSLDKFPIATVIGNPYTPSIDEVFLTPKSIVIFSVQFLIIGSSFSIELPSQGTSYPYLIDILVILLDSANQLPETVYSFNCNLTGSSCKTPWQLINKTGEFHFGIYCDVGGCTQTNVQPSLQLNKAVYDFGYDVSYCQVPCSMENTYSFYILVSTSIPDYPNKYSSIDLICTETVVTSTSYHTPSLLWILLLCSTLLYIISATSVVNLCIAIYTWKIDNGVERQSPRPTPNPNIHPPPHNQAPPQYTPVAPLI